VKPLSATGSPADCFTPVEHPEGCPSEIRFAVVNEFHEVNPVQRGESVSNSKREKVERESCEKGMILCGPFPGWWF